MVLMSQKCPEILQFSCPEKNSCCRQACTLPAAKIPRMTHWSTPSSQHYHTPYLLVQRWAVSHW